MSTASIENIKQLRSKLDAPYQDCVKALQMHENDIEAASKWLKNQGKANVKNAKTEHGAIGFCMNQDLVAVAMVGCETDFVAINPEFISMVDELAQNAHDNPHDDSKSIEKFNEAAWVFKEAMKPEISYYHNSTPGKMSVYLHHNRTKLTVLYYEGDNEDVAQRITMQACAMKPTCVSVEQVPPQVYQEMMENAKQEALTSGKPPEIVDKIATGKVKSMMKEFVLLEQSMFDDAKSTVGQIAEKANVRVIGFVNITL